eukprot:509620-Amphidinium_carterae.1
MGLACRSVATQDGRETANDQQALACTQLEIWIVAFGQILSQAAQASSHRRVLECFEIKTGTCLWYPMRLHTISFNHAENHTDS